jgi:hypothetical protein
MGGWLLEGHNSRHGRWYFRDRACREPARPASSPQARMEASTADRTPRRLPYQATQFRSRLSAAKSDAYKVHALVRILFAQPGILLKSLRICSFLARRNSPDNSAR